MEVINVTMFSTENKLFYAITVNVSISLLPLSISFACFLHYMRTSAPHVSNFFYSLTDSHEIRVGNRSLAQQTLQASFYEKRIQNRGATPKKV
jgi:hypothetical protein